MSSIAALPAMALGCVLSTIVKNVVIKAWLPQQHKHEADVIRGAISKAAGCSSEDILYSMSCDKFHSHELALLRTP